MTPTNPSNHSNNYYAVLTDFDKDDNDDYTQRLPDKCESAASDLTTAMPQQSPTALCDLGATSHFITGNVHHVLNKQPAPSRRRHLTLHTHM